MATSGDRYLATSGDFFMATDRRGARPSIPISPASQPRKIAITSSTPSKA